MTHIHSSDHVTRVGEIQDYVAAQIALLETTDMAAEKVADYILTNLRSDESYEEEKDDERILRKAVSLSL